MLLASDIHFGSNRPADIKAFLKAASHPSSYGGIVVLCGDFTQRATATEYRQAEDFVKQLMDSDAVVVLTPGNHDFGIPGLPGTDKLAAFLPADLDRARPRFQRLMSLVESQEAVVASEDYDTITRVGDDVYVSLRSTHRGIGGGKIPGGVNRIRSRQIGWARKELEIRPELLSLRLHLVTHRSLWGGKHGPMYRGERLERDLLERLGFFSFIHGHNHQFDQGRIFTPHLQYELYRIGLPTLSEREGDHRRSYAEWSPPGECRLVEV